MTSKQFTSDKSKQRTRNIRKGFFPHISFSIALNSITTENTIDWRIQIDFVLSVSLLAICSESNWLYQRYPMLFVSNFKRIVFFLSVSSLVRNDWQKNWTGRQTDKRMYFLEQHRKQMKFDAYRYWVRRYIWPRRVWSACSIEITFVNHFSAVYKTLRFALKMHTRLRLLFFVRGGFVRSQTLFRFILWYSLIWIEKEEMKRKLGEYFQNI